MKDKNGISYEFGAFILDTKQNLLLHGSERVKLPAKTFELLLFFVRNSNQVIDKETLMLEVWKDLFVEDANLAVHISNLRKILNGDVNGKSAIETFPKAGYRFNADVSQPSSAENEPVVAVSEKRTGLRFGFAVFASLALFGVFAAAWWFFSFSKVTGPDKAPKVSRLTNIGTVTESNISPNGKYVAYARAEKGGRFSIWLKAVGEQSEVQVLPPTEGSCFALSFMPDGRSIVYGNTDRERKPASYVMPLFGGNSVKMPLNYEARVVYSPDGSRKAYIDGHLSQGLNFLMIADADGSDPRILSTRKHPVAFDIGGPIAWSPDGKKIAAVKEDAAGFHVAVIDSETGVDTGEQQEAWNLITGLAWRPDMSGILITGAEWTSAISQVWHISLTDGTRKRITNDTNNYTGANISADGRTLITQDVRSPSSISVVPVAGVADSPELVTIETANAVKISSSLADGDIGAHSQGGIDWSPDGRLVFVSQESGNDDIWSMNSDGTGRRQLTTDPHRDTSAAVSPDGSIAFISTRTGRYVLWLMDADGQHQRQIKDADLDLGPPSFDQDGKWIYFRCWKTGLGTIWRTPVDGGSPEQVIDKPTAKPQISPDGKWLLYNTRDPTLFALRPLEGGPVAREFQPGPHDQFRHNKWLPSSNAFSFLMGKDGFKQLWLQPIEGGPPRQLTNFSENVNSYAWSRDGKKIALALGTTTTDVIMMKLAD